jgi:phospholipid/cholesterol/gamma-HCH transport system substrate-binding protein
MISSYIKKQLIVFSILALSAALVIVFVYAHIPTVLGIGQMKLTAMFSDGAGIYTNGNVTARGVGIGKVTSVAITPQGVAVTMSIDASTKVGADARAEIHSVSAVGEQYVDLISDQPAGPYLQPGEVIPVSRTSVPEQIAPVLDKATNLLASIPNDGLQTFLDEGYKAFQNLGPDLRTLVDSSGSLIDAADQNYGQTAQLINTIGPLLDTQNVAADSVRAYFHNLADFTGVLRHGDGHLRGSIRAVHGAVDAVTDFLDDNENGVPILAHNLETVGQVLGVYRPGIEQILVEYPIADARMQIGLRGSPRGLRAGLAGVLSVGECTTGFKSGDLRNANDLSDKDGIPNTYCKVPHNDPRAVRGARNIPCLEGHVGMRAALIDECLGRTPDQTSGSSPGLTPRLPFDAAVPSPQRTPFDPPDNQDDYAHDSGSPDPLAQLGGMGSASSGKEETWQSLLTAPLDR